MKKITRADLLGHPLDNFCREAKTTTHEFGKQDNRVFCFGRYEEMNDMICSQCKKCKAYVYNAKPLVKGE